MTNLVTPSINMIPLNSSMSNSNANPATIIQPQMISTNGATIQPAQTFIQQPTGTFQIHQTTPQPTPQTQFQVINTANNNGAIINSNQLIGSSNGQQFILNQTLTPANNPQSIYQLVLSNGQIIQTLQPPTTQLVPSSILATQTHSSALTVPIQNTTNQVNPGTILAPGIAFTNQTAGTSFMTQPTQPQLSVNSTLQLTPTAQQTIMPTNNVFSNQSASMGTTMRENNFINLNPMGNNAQTVTMANLQTSLNSNNAASLTMPPTSMIVNQNSLQSPLTTTSTTNSTTTMMVLTPSNINDNSSLVSMFDQKSIKSINNKKENGYLNESLNGCLLSSQIRLDTKGSASNKNKNKLINLNGPKLPNGFNENGKNYSNNPTLPSNNNNSISNNKTNQLKDKIVSNNGDILFKNNISINEDPLPRPLSVDSSNGSLRIAEDDKNDDDEDDDEKIVDSKREEINDNVSSGTEIDSTSLDYDNELKINNGKDDCKNVHSTMENVVKLNSKDEKEGYQSSYGGSPCHFTDTEDEEEEERNENGEIKLIRRNGLTQAAFNLINNRILSSEDDCATTVSVDSKCSSATSMLNEELCSINGENKNRIDKVSIQIQTSDTSSPANSLHSNDSQIEAESSTTQNTLISSKGNGGKF